MTRRTPFAPFLGLALALALAVATIPARGGLDLLSLNKSPIQAMAFSPDGNLLALSSVDGVWGFDMKKGTKLWHRGGAKDPGFDACHAATFSPDGKTLALRCAAALPTLLDAATGTPGSAWDGAAAALAAQVEVPKVPEGLVPEGEERKAGAANPDGSRVVVVTRDESGTYRIRGQHGQFTDDGEVFVACGSVDAPALLFRPDHEQLVLTCRGGLLFFSLDKFWDIGSISVFPGGGWRIYARSGHYTGDADGLRRLCGDWDDPEYVPDAKVDFGEVAEWMGFDNERREHPGVARKPAWRRGETELCKHWYEGIPSRNALEEEISNLVTEGGGEWRITEYGDVTLRPMMKYNKFDQFWLGDIGEIDEAGDAVFLSCRKSEGRSGRTRCVRSDFKLVTMSSTIMLPDGKGARMKQLLDWLLLRRPEYGPQRRAPW